MKQVTFLAVELFRVLESVPDDLFGTRTRDQFETFLDLIGLAVLDTGVRIFFVFADDDDVHDRVLRLNERVIRDARADVGVQAKSLSHCNVER